MCQELAWGLEQKFASHARSRKIPKSLPSHDSSFTLSIGLPAVRSWHTIELMSSNVEHPIDRAERLIAVSPVVALDLALIALAQTREHRSEPDTGHYLEVVARAILTATSPSINASGADPLATVFADHRCDRYAAAALLRLTVLDDTVFDNRQLSHGAIPLFDRVAGPRVYDRIGLSAKSQTFEKIDGLRTAIEDHEVAFQSHIQSLNALAALSTFRQRLFQILKDSYTTLCIGPFLPPTITQQALSELLGSVESCAEAADDVAMLAFDDANRLLDGADDVTDRFPTSYCVELFGTLDAKLRNLIRADVGRRGLADPAALSFRVRPKCHPMHAAGLPLKLRLDVTNSGKGHAIDTELAITGDQCVEFAQQSVSLGRVKPGTRAVLLEGRVRNPGSRDAVLVNISWRNSDGSLDSFEQLVEIDGRPTNVAWTQLEAAQPYSLEPVKNSADFAGRAVLLRQLGKAVRGAEPGNFTIGGQKRVGKTSLAYALRESVERAEPGKYHFLFLECGDFTLNTAEASLARLGARVCELARSEEPAMAGIPDPDFSEGIAPLVDFFEAARTRAPEKKFIIILDEFDSMPHRELYEVGRIGSTFFQNLRSLGGKPNLGFGLVGSERMKPVLSAQAQELNKFQQIEVDYFDEPQFQDYGQLLREPVREWVDIDDDAVRLLYEATGGHPYITKAVAIEMFDLALDAQDGDIRIDDMRDAIAVAVPKLGARAFAHYWDDGVSGADADVEYMSVRRRRVLLALASCLRASQVPTVSAIADAASSFQVPQDEALEILRSFRERRIFRESSEGHFRCRVPLFERWLAEEGVTEIAASMTKSDAVARRAITEERERITHSDVAPLSKRWGTYKGEPVGPERIQSWLRQFGKPSEQRLMLKMLSELLYFNGTGIRSALRELHGIVIRDLAEAGHSFTFKGRKKTRTDLVVAPLDYGGSGATALLKPYRDENEIAADCVVGGGNEIASAVTRSGTGIHAVVLLDDFVGTGETATRELGRIHTDIESAGGLASGVEAYLLVIAGFDAGVDRVRKEVSKLGWDLRIHVAKPLDESDRCFSGDSAIFPDEDERIRARALAVEKGRALVKDHPLGHDDSQAAVVFEGRCPNNSLPILWQSNETWVPLFPRF